MVKFYMLVISTLLVSLMIISLATINQVFSNDNDIIDVLSQDDSYSNLSSNINSGLDEINDVNPGSTNNNSVESQKINFQNEGRNPVITALGFFFNSIVSAGNTFINAVTFTFNAVFAFAEETIGVPKVVTATLISILTIVLIFAAWKMLRVGE